MYSRSPGRFVSSVIWDIRWTNLWSLGAALSLVLTGVLLSWLGGLVSLIAHVLFSIGLRPDLLPCSPQLGEILCEYALHLHRLHFLVVLQDDAMKPAFKSLHPHCFIPGGDGLLSLLVGLVKAD